MDYMFIFRAIISILIIILITRIWMRAAEFIGEQFGIGEVFIKLWKWKNGNPG